MIGILGLGSMPVSKAASNLSAISFQLTRDNVDNFLCSDNGSPFAHTVCQENSWKVSIGAFTPMKVPNGTTYCGQIQLSTASESPFRIYPFTNTWDENSQYKLQNWSDYQWPVTQEVANTKSTLTLTIELVDSGGQYLDELVLAVAPKMGQQDFSWKDMCLVNYPSNSAINSSNSINVKLTYQYATVYFNGPNIKANQYERQTFTSPSISKAVFIPAKHAVIPSPKAAPTPKKVVVAKAGSSCSNSGQVKKSGSSTLVCAKVKGKKTWVSTGSKPTKACNSTQVQLISTARALILDRQYANSLLREQIRQLTYDGRFPNGMGNDGEIIRRDYELLNQNEQDINEAEDIINNSNC